MKLNLFRVKKGQAALEFLMTYGWAVLVVLIVIGAIAFFLSANNPTDLIPEQCTISDGFFCDDALISVAGDNITIKFINNKGETITLDNVTASSSEVGNCTPTNASLTTANPITSGESVTLTLDQSDSGCTVGENLTAGQKIKVDLAIAWYSTRSGEDFTHTASGSLLANVES